MSEGRARLDGRGPHGDRRSQVSPSARAPVSEALKLSLFDRDPGRESIREREREEIEKSRSLFRLERVSEAELAPSLSLTHEQDNFSLDLDLPSLKMNSR